MLESEEEELPDCSVAAAIAQINLSEWRSESGISGYYGVQAKPNDTFEARFAIGRDTTRGRLGTHDTAEGAALAVATHYVKATHKVWEIRFQHTCQTFVVPAFDPAAVAAAAQPSTGLPTWELTPCRLDLSHKRKRDNIYTRQDARYVTLAQAAMVQCGSSYGAELSTTRLRGALWTEVSFSIVTMVRNFLPPVTMVKKVNKKVKHLDNINGTGPCFDSPRATIAPVAIHELAH